DPAACPPAPSRPPLRTLCEYHRPASTRLTPAPPDISAKTAAKTYPYSNPPQYSYAAPLDSTRNIATQAIPFLRRSQPETESIASASRQTHATPARFQSTTRFQTHHPSLRCKSCLRSPVRPLPHDPGAR